MVRKRIDIRITIEGGTPPRTIYPLGIFLNWEHEHQILEIPEPGRPYGYSVQPHWRGPYAAILDTAGYPIWKFVMPTEPSLEYKTVRFLDNGVWVLFEIRWEEVTENE